MHAFGRAALRALLVVSVLSAAPVMAADPPPLSAYGDLPALEQGSLSPGGSLALLGQFKGKRMLVRGGKLDRTYQITVPENLDGVH